MFGSPVDLLKKRWKAIFLFSILIAFLSAFVTLFFPLKYRSNSQVYIISQNRYGVDPYTNVKSAEKVGENLIQVIRTTDFYGKVKNEDNSIDWSYFESSTEKKKREKWLKTLEANMVYGTSVMNINIYHPKPEEAKKISEAVAKTLVAKSWEYVGGDITIKIINTPILSSYPVKPNFILNAFFGFLIALFFSGLWTIKK
jgi:capsular polysaccharide biosynthesis protein